MDIKRTLLWVIFSVSGVMLFNSWQIQNGKEPLLAGLLGTPPVQNAMKKEVNPSGTPAISSNSLPSTGAATATSLNKEPSKIIHLKNDVIDLEVDTRGGSLIKATLQSHSEGGKPVNIFHIDDESKYFARNGLIATGIDLPNHNDIFIGQLSPDGQTLTLVNEKNGIQFEKTYQLDNGSYVVNTNVKVTNKSSHVISPSLYTELVRDGLVKKESKFYSTFTGPAVYTDKEKFHKVDFTQIEKNKVSVATELTAGETGWVAMVQHYFASAWIPEDQKNREFYFDKLEINNSALPDTPENHLYRAGMKTPLGDIASGATSSIALKLFVGPQEEEVLAKIAPGLELVKDYGWLTIIAKPIFWLLTKIHSVVLNWGWSIILLTVFIKLLFFPLSAASYKSMARMKEVQPRLALMKEQFKGEPQKLNQAMMEMYRKEKINPMGGCLPVVIQIPVFISLYWVLLASVEMRGAPWLGWIHDLSIPDPFYILPVVMAVSMFVQTKLNPKPPDPVQAKVMAIMPIAFSVMFFFFPAGLVLYWVVNNVLSIAQQWQINRMFGAKKA